MEDVKSIEFGFENCECFTIDAKYFGTLELMDFETQIRRNACNSISKTNFVNTVAIEIFSEGNGDYHPFEIKNETMKFFDRLQEYNDIVDLTITYSDDTIENYYVDYDEGGDDSLGAPNINQHSYMNKFGDLYIVISKDKSIFDFFDEEMINDEKLMQMEKTMVLD